MTHLEWLKEIETQHQDFETLPYAEYKAKYDAGKRSTLLRLIEIFAPMSQLD